MRIEASHQQPAPSQECDCIILEENPLSPVKPSNDCIQTTTSWETLKAIIKPQEITLVSLKEKPMFLC